MKMIADMTGRSPETVKDALLRLFALGEIVCVEQGGGKAKANTYRITLSNGIQFPESRIPPSDYEP